MSHFYSSGNLVDLKVLPQTLLEKVQQFGDKFKLMLEAKVVKVTQDKDKVQYVYDECDHHLALTLPGRGGVPRTTTDEFCERGQSDHHSAHNRPENDTGLVF